MHLDHPRHDACTRDIPAPYRGMAYVIASALDAWQAARDRRARDRATQAAIERLGETSPHLLEDIGMDGIDRH